MSKLHRFPLALLLCLVAAPMPMSQAAQRAYSVPSSDKLVRLEVQMTDGRWVRGMVQEGDQFRTTDHDKDLTLAFIPVARGEEIDMRVFRVVKYPSGDEAMQFLEEVKLYIGGEPGLTKKASSASAVRVLEVITPKK